MSDEEQKQLKEVEREEKEYAYDLVQGRAQRVREIVESGRVSLAGVLARITDAPHYLDEEFDYGGSIPHGIFLDIVDGLLDEIEKVPSTVPVIPNFERRARELCADLLELTRDEDHGVYDGNAVDELRAKARALLVGGDA